MNRIVARLFAALTVLAVLVGAAVPVRAQDYPTRPVKIIIAFPVGGLLDVVSRIVGEKLSGLTGQQFVIEARPGAGGTLATSAVARAEPDGYTLMMINDNHAINPSVFKSIPYDSVKDFAPIGFVGSAPLVFSVHAGLPLRSVKDLVAMAREKPGIVTYGSVGVGSAAHLAGEMFTSAANVTMQHVPYRGGAPALNDVMGGQIPMLFASAITVIPHIQSGKVRAIAVTSAARYEGLPNVPAVAETLEGFEMPSWLAFFGPAGLPEPVARRLSDEILKALRDPEVKAKLSASGLVVVAGGPAELAAAQRRDYELKGRLIRE
ncbi:MAG: Bug family tripartite tricarboxylate transporter substrate binding protein, partial [Xanthobacteraceae bacterium]